MRERTTRRWKANPLTLIVLVLGILTSAYAAGKPFTHRLVWANQGMGKSIDTCVGRMRAAASLGYNGYIVVNHEDNFLESVDQAYINRAKTVVNEAKKLGIQLIPEHFYQNNVVYDNFNLAEAFPVRGTKFKVTGDMAISLPDHETGFKNGDFESGTAGWRLINMPGGKVVTTGAKQGKACLQISGGGKFARIQQQIKLKPYRAYRLSVWVSTKGFTNWADARFYVAFGTRSLLGKRYRPFGTPRGPYHKGVWTTLSSNQGWRLCETDFNSLNCNSAYLDFAVSDPRRTQVGTIWLDDIKLEEVGLYETVRRRTCPVVVTSIDESKTYKEGVDYIIDPKCEKFTDQSWHYQGHLKIPQGSSIIDGQELRVSWYQMSDVEQVMPEANFCITETREAYRDNVRRIDELYEHNTHMYLGFDEWRTAFWDDRCELYPKATTAGEYMAGALKMSHDLVWSTSPSRELYMWNDMYDPYHNAWKPYAMTNGGCLNSWKDMDTNLVIVNWRPGPHWNNMSMRFYMGIDDSLNPEGRVWRQVLNCLSGAHAANWLNLLEKAEKDGGKGVVGVQFVNWGIDYSQLSAVKNACLGRGRWGTGPLPARRIVSVKETVPSIAKSRAAQLYISPRSDQRFEVSYRLQQNAEARLEVVNLQGRRVQTLDRSDKIAGEHQLVWDASSLAAGMYFLKLTVDGIGRQTLKQIVF